MTVRCPHCSRDIGGPATEGGLRLRLGIVLLDPSDGRVHGPCPHCKGDVEVTRGGDVAKAMRPPAPTTIPARRVFVVPGVPRGG